MKSSPKDLKPFIQETRVNRLRRILLYILPFVLFFSYHPRFSLGVTSSMNLELSLPLLWLALFALLSLPSLPSNLRHFARLFPRHRYLFVCLVLAFPVYLTLSILWSPNPLRAILTAGIFWCLLLSILTIPRLIVKNKIKKGIVKSFLISSVLVAGFCWLQCLLDVFQVNSDITLLCEGCSYRSFGFPHPNGFAIEPQFMGNLLLAPAFFALYLLFKHPTRKKVYLPLSLFLLSTLFLTFSRGAIYAFALGLVMLVVVRLIQTKRSRPLLALPLVACAFVITLCAQGMFAQLSPTSDTFLSGVDKVVNQLSLGHLSIPLASSQENHAVEETPEATQANTAAANAQSYFSGYVSESTEIRTMLTTYALDAWGDSPQRLLFGTGLASSGETLYQKFPTLGSPKEIVQNEYATLLLELGVVGCVLLLLSLILLAKNTLPLLSRRERAYFLALELAFAASIFFFSGLPNALHIYLLPVLGYSCSSTRKKFVS